MSHNHNNNGHSEPKSVAFTTPLILGVVAVFIILCFVSLGNPCHGKCCNEGECKKECSEKCEKGGHEAKSCGECEGCIAGKECTHPSESNNEEHAEESEAAVNDSTKTTSEPAKEEGHH